MEIFLFTTALAIILILFWALRDNVQPALPEQKKETHEEADKIFRRRATDREIEQEYTEEKTPARRKSDYAKEKTPREGLSIPYPAEEIISPTSRFKVYRQILINAQNFGARGDYITAMSLYQGVYSRINDSQVRYKIEENIDYLKSMKRKQTEQKQAKPEKAEQEPIREVRLSIDGNLPQTINIGVPEVEKLKIDEITRNLSRELKSDIQHTINNLRAEILELKEMSATDRRSELEKMSNELSSLKDGLHNIPEIQKDLKDLYSKIHEIASHPVPEVERPPTIIEAKYDSPIPLQLDPGPILELLEKLPGKLHPEKEAAQEPEPEKDEKIKAEEEKTGEAAEKKEAAPEEPSGPVLEKETERERILEDEEENENEFELLKEYGKDKDEEETLTDEDIFEKILEETQKREDQDSRFEIMGDHRSEDEIIDIHDTESEKKHMEDERFYRKFLRGNKIRKRELPILKVSYDFNKLPDQFSLSKEKNILEYSFYKYRPMLLKAQDLIKRKRVRDAINYYRVVMGQNIPPEFKSMVRRNIRDLTEYLEKYLSMD